MITLQLNPTTSKFIAAITRVQGRAEDECYNNNNISV